MVGHKVRCQCGFVFRLGPKHEKQPGVAEEIRRRKKLKQALRTKNKEIDAAPVRPDQVLDPSKVKPVAAIVLPDDSQEEIIDGVPVATPLPSPGSAAPVPAQPIPAQPVPQQQQPYPGQLPVQPYPTQPYPAQPYSTQPPAHYAGQQPPGYFQPNPLADLPEFGGPQHALPIDNSSLQNRLPLPGTPPQKKKRPRRKNEKHLNSVAGPTWTLILCLVGIPFMVLIMLKFGSPLYEQYQKLAVLNNLNIGQSDGLIGIGLTSKLAFMLLCLVLVALLGTTISLIASGVVAVIELTKGIHIGWASKVAAIFATVTIALVFLLFAVQVFNIIQAAESLKKLGEQVGRDVDTSRIGYAIGKMAGRAIVIAGVPLIIAMFGFARNVKER